MQKFSYYRFVKEAARVPGGARNNGRRGQTRLNKFDVVSPQFGVIGQGVSGVRDNSMLQAIVDDVAAYGRMGRQQAKKLVNAAAQIAQATGYDITDVLKSVLAKGKGAANKAGAAVKSGIDAAGEGLGKAKDMAATGKDALIGAYEKARPVVQEAGQKALAWMKDNKSGIAQGLRDAGLGALLFDAATDED